MSRSPRKDLFSLGVDRALRVAYDAHRGQVRKSSAEVPYFTHPVHVALMLARLDMDEEVLQAGVLHDIVEDCEGWSIERLGDEFGERVARIVAELTEDKSRTWRERKQWAVDHAPRLSAEAATIKACDKLHNLESLLVDLRRAEDPSTVWRRFNGGRTATLTMSRLLVDALAPRVSPALGSALRAVMRALETEAG